MIAQPSSGFEKFTKDGKEGLKNIFGETQIPANFDDLGWSDNSEINGNIIAYKSKGKWGLITVENKIVTAPEYYSITPFAPGQFKAGVTRSLSNKLLFGLLNEKGKVILSCYYFELVKAKDTYIYGVYEDGKVLYGVMNDNFDPLIPQKFRSVERIDNVFATKDFDNKWQFYDSSGKLILDKVDSYKLLDQKGITVEAKGAMGLIDSKSAKLLFDLEYKSFSVLEDEYDFVEPKKWDVYSMSLRKTSEFVADSAVEKSGLIASYLNGVERLHTDSSQILPNTDFELKQATKDFLVIHDIGRRKWLAMKRNEVILAEGDSIYFDGDYFFVEQSGAWQIYNKFGRKISKAPFEEVSGSIESYIPVARHGQWGVIDFQGSTVIKFVYDHIKAAPDLTFQAQYVGAWGLLSVFEDWVITPQFDSMKIFGNLGVGYENGRSKLFDHKGKVLYSTRRALRYKDDYIEVIGLEDVGLISCAGQVVFDPIYSNVGNLGGYFTGRRLEGIVVKDSTSKFVVDLDMEIEEVLECSEGYFHIIKNGLHGFTDDQGRLRIANRYDSARGFSNGMAAIKLIGKWGFIDVDENLRVQPTYTKVYDFVNDLAIVYDGAYGLIDKNGSLKLELDYSSIKRTTKGSFIITDKEGRKGLTDKSGGVILSPSFDYMEDIGQGLIVVSRGLKKGIYSSAGELKVSFEFNEILQVGEYLIMTRD